MAEPTDMIVPLLQEMRTENKALHEAAAERLALIEVRLKKLEEAQVSYRQALSADSLLSKLVTGEFEERIGNLEQRIRAIDTLERKIKELEAHK